MFSSTQPLYTQLRHNHCTEEYEKYILEKLADLLSMIFTQSKTAEKKKDTLCPSDYLLAWCHFQGLHTLSWCWHGWRERRVYEHYGRRKMFSTVQHLITLALLLLTFLILLKFLHQFLDGSRFERGITWSNGSNWSVLQIRDFFFFSENRRVYTSILKCSKIIDSLPIRIVWTVFWYALCLGLLCLLCVLHISTNGKRKYVQIRRWNIISKWWNNNDRGEQRQSVWTTEHKCNLNESVTCRFHVWTNALTVFAVHIVHCTLYIAIQLNGIFLEFFFEFVVALLFRFAWWKSLELILQLLFAEREVSFQIKNFAPIIAIIIGKSFQSKENQLPSTQISCSAFSRHELLVSKPIHFPSLYLLLQTYQQLF